MTMYENIVDLDFGVMVDIVLSILIEIFKLPIKMYQMIPSNVRMIIPIFFLILSIIILILIYKFREEYKYVKY